MKIGIAGMGAIGLRVAQELDQGGIPGCTLAGFSARSTLRAAEANAQLSTPVPCYELGEIANRCDLVIETLPPALLHWGLGHGPARLSVFHRHRRDGQLFQSGHGAHHYDRYQRVCAIRSFSHVVLRVSVDELRAPSAVADASCYKRPSRDDTRSRLQCAPSARRHQKSVSATE